MLDLLLAIEGVYDPSLHPMVPSAKLASQELVVYIN